MRLSIQKYAHADLNIVNQRYDRYAYGHFESVLENRVLRRIYGSEREEDESWRKLHNDELHSLYS
jgi:hypothetical protein